MRRLGRWTLNALTVLSLVLCVGTVGLWVRGLARSRSWDVSFGGRFFGVVDTRHGKVEWVWLRLLDPSPPRDITLAKFSFMGISYEHLLLDNGVDQSAAELPLWVPSLFLALLPIFWFVRNVIRARRTRPGRCTCCGYDLRATPDRCPECGTAAKGAAT